MAPRNREWPSVSGLTQAQLRAARRQEVMRRARRVADLREEDWTYEEIAQLLGVTHAQVARAAKYGRRYASQG